MIERPLMTPDELKSMPKGHFIVTKTGAYPMRTRLKLFTEWGMCRKKIQKLPHRARAVYMYLHDRADKDGKCYPAIGTVSYEG